eukprot:725091-Amphidinium_carterae.1
MIGNLQSAPHLTRQGQIGSWSANSSMAQMALRVTMVGCKLRQSPATPVRSGCMQQANPAQFDKNAR